MRSKGPNASLLAAVRGWIDRNAHPYLQLSERLRKAVDYSAYALGILGIWVLALHLEEHLLTILAALAAVLSLTALLIGKTLQEYAARRDRNPARRLHMTSTAIQAAVPTTIPSGIGLASDDEIPEIYAFLNDRMGYDQRPPFSRLGLTADERIALLRRLRSYSDQSIAIWREEGTIVRVSIVLLVSDRTRKMLSGGRIIWTEIPDFAEARSGDSIALIATIATSDQHGDVVAGMSTPEAVLAHVSMLSSERINTLLAIDGERSRADLLRSAGFKLETMLPTGSGLWARTLETESDAKA